LIETLIRRQRAVDRTNIDDRSAARFRHGAAEHLAAQEHALHVDRHHAIPRSLRIRFERTVLLDRRIRRRVERGGVDEPRGHVPAHLDGVQRGAERSPICHVGAEQADAIILGEFVGHRNVCSVDNGDPRASRGQAVREHPAELTEPPGQHHNAAVERKYRM